MKKILFFAVISLLGFQSCDKLLDEENRSNATSEYFNTAAGFEDALRGAYSFTRYFYATEEGLSLTVFGTDEYTEGSDGSYKDLNQYNAAMNASYGAFANIWENFYKGINSANTVIARADKITGITQAVRTARVAEAKFLRANYYFVLVQFFGPIPVVKDENVSPSTESHRNSLKEVYDLITEDLDFAIANLPTTQSEWGRATQYAAQHLSAKVHLTRATMDKTAQAANEYQKSLDAALAIISSKAFTLLPDFANVFAIGAGEINSEVIWSVQYINDVLTNGDGNSAHLYFLMAYDGQFGMKRDIVNGRPFKRFKPNDYALNVFNRDIDSRYDKSYKTVWYCNNPGTYTINGKSMTLALGDTAIWLPGVELSSNVINSKKFQVLTPSKYSTTLFPTLTKFLDPNRPDISETRGSRDFLAFRFAETYLIAAEAQLGLGNKTEAAKWVNVVRTRAAKLGKVADMQIAPSDITLSFILDERSRELLGEQCRWFDLVRTGQLLERVKKYNSTLMGTPTIKDYHILRPIPQKQIDRVKNADGTVFGQNPGY